MSLVIVETDTGEEYEIVMCKDCKYWKRFLGGYHGNDYWTCSRFKTEPTDWNMTADDFCSRAEIGNKTT